MYTHHSGKGEKCRESNTNKSRTSINSDYVLSDLKCEENVCACRRRREREIEKEREREGGGDGGRVGERERDREREREREGWRKSGGEREKV